MEGPRDCDGVAKEFMEVFLLRGPKLPFAVFTARSVVTETPSASSCECRSCSSGFMFRVSIDGVLSAWSCEPWNYSSHMAQHGFDMDLDVILQFGVAVDVGPDMPVATPPAI